MLRRGEAARSHALVPARPPALFQDCSRALALSSTRPPTHPSVCLLCCAGKAGRVFTLLRHEDVRHFKGMLRKADNTFVADHKLPPGALEAVSKHVRGRCLLVGRAGEQRVFS